MPEHIHIVEPWTVCTVRLMKERSFSVPVNVRITLSIRPRDRFQVHLRLGTTEYPLWTHLSAHNRVHIYKDLWIALGLTAGQRIDVRVIRPVRDDK